MAEPDPDDWFPERHAVPDGLRAGEPHPADSYAYVVDQGRVPPGIAGTPPEAIVGCYLIGADGRATGEFLRNPMYVPDEDDFALVEADGVHLEWLAGPPGLVLRDVVEDLLGDTEVVRMHVVDGPRSRMRGEPMAEQPDLSGLAVPQRTSRWARLGRRREQEEPERPPQAMLLTDAAVAMTVTLWARPRTARPLLMHGVLTVVRTHLTTDHRATNAWLEREPTLDAAEALLESRIHEVRAERDRRERR